MSFLKRYKFLIIILGLSLLRFFDLPIGFHLGEPDTIIHRQVLENLSINLRPFYQGAGWYYGLPLYFYISSLVNLITQNIDLALILVSVFFGGLLNVAVYWYLSKKINETAGFFGALTFALSPSLIFYSRIGLIEMTVIAFSFIFLFLFDIGTVLKNLRYVILSGFSLGLAIFTKYTALIFVFVPVIYACLEFLKTRRFKLPALYSFTSLAIAGLVPLPIVIYFILVDRFRFRQLTQATLLETPEFWGKAGTKFYFLEYLEMIPLWVGVGVIGLALVGLGSLISQKLKNWELFLISFIIALFFVMRRSPSPRYFVVLVPFFAILAGVGLYYLYTQVKKLQISGIYSQILVILALILLIPEAGYAYFSGNHKLVEDTAVYLNKISPGENNVFSTYWPNLFTAAGTGKKTSWLTGSPHDLTAFGNGFSPGKNSLQVLQEEGGYVLVEDLYSNALWRDMDKAGVVTSDVRKGQKELIEKVYTPIAVIEDSRPNFPYFFNTSHNSITIYEIKPLEDK